MVAIATFDLENPLTASIVICTRNRPHNLERCLRSLSRQTQAPDEVIVVENVSDDQSARRSAVRWGARYLREPAPGLSRARNLGARASQAELVAFLDDDCEPQPDWLGALTAEFQNSTVMAVTGRIQPLSLETEVERACVAAGGQGPQLSTRLAVDRSTRDWFEIVNFGGIGTGNNMAFRRSLFDRWPGFDERLGRGAPISGGEEAYAFFQVAERGYKIVHTPAAVVQHPCPRSLQELRSRQLADFSNATAFMALLFFENPRYRIRLLKYAVGGVVGVRRRWRNNAGAIVRLRTASPAEVFRRRWQGVFQYLRLRKERQIAARRPAFSPSTTEDC